MVAETKSTQVGLSAMPSDDFQQAAEPLFDNDEVELVEWSFDMGWGRPLSRWLHEILDEHSKRDSLLGHGVSYSVLDASETTRQAHWLQQLRDELNERRYRHISEHFGFMGGGNFHIASPLPVPRTEEAVAVGQQRLMDLANVSQCPIGLENLAFAFSPQDVWEQGPFLDELLEPVNGFLLLDLHNLYCQACNFSVDFMELVKGYPLERVRELHLSGGSWSEHPAGSGQQVRRDTHDDAVPEELFRVLPLVLDKCPNVNAVVLERIEGTIANQADAEQFRADFRRIKLLVNEVAAC